MSRLQKSRSLRRWAVTAVVASLAVGALAEQVIVKSDVAVKSDKNPFADAVETVGSDTKLEVLAHDNGWLRVRTPGGKEGFISEGDLPPNTSLAGVQGNGQAGQVSNDAALRGLQDDAEAYAKSKSFNTAGVEQMIAWGKTISDADVVAFANAGHVGPAKYRK